MNFLRNNLANAFTLGNLFSGCLGVISLLKGNYEITALCLLISAVLDFFDGFVARALKANSSLGVQLDSLADMVTFGLIPGLTLYTALEETQPEFSWLKYAGLLVTLFSCLRLAIFNLDEEQKYYFKGLNTPTNTFLIFGLYYAFKEEGFLAGLMNEPWGPGGAGHYLGRAAGFTHKDDFHEIPELFGEGQHTQDCAGRGRNFNFNHFPDSRGAAGSGVVPGRFSVFPKKIGSVTPRPLFLAHEF